MFSQLKEEANDISNQITLQGLSNSKEHNKELIIIASYCTCVQRTADLVRKTELLLSQGMPLHVGTERGVPAATCAVVMTISLSWSLCSREPVTVIHTYAERL